MSESQKINTQWLIPKFVVYKGIYDQATSFSIKYSLYQDFKTWKRKLKIF